MKFGTIPDGFFPCWYTTEEEIQKAKKAKRPFGEYTDTDDFFRLTNRIDNTFIQGNLNEIALI
jgi:hypothetical protein